MKIGMNIGPNAPFSPCVVSNNLAHHGKYGGNDYPTKYADAWVVAHGAHRYMPEGEYVIANPSEAPIAVRRFSGTSEVVVPAHDERTVSFTRGEGGFAAYGTYASRVQIRATGTFANGLSVSDRMLDKLRPFAQVRTMDLQRINGSNATSYPPRDEGFRGDFNDPYALYEIYLQTGKKTVRPCVPHLYPEDQLRGWMQQLSEWEVKCVIEHSNEVAFNSGNSQYREVGDLYGAGETSTEGRTWLGHARRTALMTSIAAEIGDPDIRITLGAQADNDWLTGYLLRAFRDAGGNFEWLHSVSIAPYYGHQHDDWTNGPAGVMVGAVDDAVGDLERQIVAADKYGVGIDWYEGGQHLGPVPDGMQSEAIAWLRSDEAGEMEADYLRRAGVLMDQQPNQPQGGAVAILYDIAHDNTGANPWGYYDSTWDENVVPRLRAVLDYINGTQPDEPEPTDVRDLNQDGVFDIADVRIAQDVAGKIAMRYLTETGIRAEADALANGGGA